MRYQGCEVSVPIVEIVPIIVNAGCSITSPDQKSQQEESIDYVEQSIISQGFAVIRSDYLNYLVVAQSDAVVVELAQMGELETNQGVIVARPRAGVTTEARQHSNANWPAFPRDVSECRVLMNIARDIFFHRLARRLLHADPVPDPRIYLRAITSGYGTQVHVDRPTKPLKHMRSLTFWLSLLDINLEMGAIFFPETTESTELIRNQYWWENSSERSEHMSTIADDINSLSFTSRCNRLHTMCFRAGDVVIFPSTTLHGTFDHTDSAHRTRLSMDCRWTFFGLK